MVFGYYPESGDNYYNIYEHEYSQIQVLFLLLKCDHPLKRL